MNERRILIAGAGIGGIVAALALLQRGFHVSLYEQAADLHELGAGLQISPNGALVLRELGLQPAIEAVVSFPTAREMRLFDTGQTWRVGNVADAATRFGAPFWLVHRGDLHRGLATALERRAPSAVQVGARCVGFEQDAAGVTLLLENGQRVRGAALIGADGVHSRIREALFGQTPAEFTGYMSWRGVVPIERLPVAVRHSSFVIWRGPRGYIITYPLRRGALLNFVTGLERNDWLIESWSEAGTIEECRRDFATWHKDVLTIIDATDTPYKWAMLGRQPLQHWSVGRVSLLGDACHPMVPSLGQGANMAIEDGMVLARCREASADVVTALHRYEVARLDRTSRIAMRSLELISLMCNNPQLADPDQAPAVMDRESTQPARNDWLYEYDAMTVPI